MLKQVEKSDRVRSLIAKSYGDENLKIDDLAVFEAVAINTLPLRRKGGLFERAVVGEDVLLEMQAYLAAGNSLPLQLMHRSGLPTGKVVAGEMRRDAAGNPSLNILFYLPKQESEIVRKIDAGIISEVSIGIEAKRILCSACGWDYLGADANIEHVFERTCAHGHTIGADGVHARLHGLDRWMEVSLVDTGAAQGAKILPRPAQTFSSDEKHGFDRTALRLFASADQVDPAESTKPGAPKPMDELITLKASVIVAERDRDSAKAEADALRTKLAELEAKLVEMEAKLAEASKTDAEALKAELGSAVAFIDELAQAAKPGVELPATLSEKLSVVKEARAKLALSLPVGGASRGAPNDTETATKANFSAFKRATR